MLGVRRFVSCRHPSPRVRGSWSSFGHRAAATCVVFRREWYDGSSANRRRHEFAAPTPSPAAKERSAPAQETAPTATVAPSAASSRLGSRVDMSLEAALADPEAVRGATAVLQRVLAGGDDVRRMVDEAMRGAANAAAEVGRAVGTDGDNAPEVSRQQQRHQQTNATDEMLGESAAGLSGPDAGSSRNVIISGEEDTRLKQRVNDYFNGDDLPALSGSAEAEADAIAELHIRACQSTVESSTRGELPPTISRPADAVSADKERKFEDALRQFMRACEAINLRVFITCGTALGCIRENRFIPHDNDIDLGVMFHDLADEAEADFASEDDLGVLGDATSSAAQHRLEKAQSRVMDLLSVLGEKTDLQCFDILGTLGKGFQLRLQHTNTGALLDLNVYYRGRQHDVGGGRGENNRYVWCATHYAASAQRKHGMYRYCNSYPLRLERRSFYGIEAAAGGVLCPDERYLTEYFGPDWRTPKVYDYDAGIAGEYKNIIPE